MRNVWLVAVREYIENVRTKAFIIGVILTPVWMGMIFLIPKLAKGQEVATKQVFILDETGVLADALKARLEPDKSLDVIVESPEGMWEPDEDGVVRVEELKIKAGAGRLFAIVLTSTALEKRTELKEGEKPSAIFGANRSTDDAMRGPRIARVVDDIVNERILAERGVDKEIAELMRQPAITYQAVDEAGVESTPAFAIMPIAFMLLLFMGIFGISQMLMSSTLEEKANRVYEVLLSSISPFALMAGKILGICAVGFTLLLIWSGGGLIAASSQGLTDIVTGGQLGLFLVYYVLGFVMIASLMVAVGSACNTLKEAQNLMAPLSVVLTLPMFMSFLIMRNPNGDFATVASFIPPFTPFVMMARIASVPPPPTWQITASILVLLVGTYIAFRLAARVFRVGILLYGQPPSLKQIFRWMRSD